MGSISRHIMPLVITSLGGGHTDTQTHTHTHCGQDQSIETRRAPAYGWRSPGLTILLEVWNIGCHKTHCFKPKLIQKVEKARESYSCKCIVKLVWRAAASSQKYILQVSCSCSHSFIQLFHNRNTYSHAPIAYAFYKLVYICILL